MSRLVVVSNRVADPRKAVAAGGLAVALGAALSATGGLWFGWSGTVVEGGAPGEGELHVQQAGSVTLATVDLCAEDHAGYYLGYSNGGKKDGKWHAIKVDVRNHRYTVRARKGYVAS